MAGAAMSAILENPILSNEQKSLLRSLRDSVLCEQFYLTGGTALAAFYTRHRVSDDLGLFSKEPFTAEDVIAVTRKRAGHLHSVNARRWQHAPCYSNRSARIGSMRLARCAGIKPAATETRPSSRIVAPAMEGSAGWTP